MTVFLACPVSSRFEIMLLLNQANYLLKDSKELQQLKNANYFKSDPHLLVVLASQLLKISSWQSTRKSPIPFPQL